MGRSRGDFQFLGLYLFSWSNLLFSSQFKKQNEWPLNGNICFLIRMIDVAILGYELKYQNKND